MGSLTIELKEGTGKLDTYIKRLESIREIEGHLKIHKTTIKDINFFPNLEKLDPPPSDLLFDKYAIAVYDNSNLLELWKPAKKVLVTRGMLFAKSNPHLCPSEVEALRKQLVYSNGSVVNAYTHTNGHRLPCDDVKMLKMNVSEGKDLHTLSSMLSGVFTNFEEDSVRICDTAFEEQKKYPRGRSQNNDTEAFNF